MRKNILLLLLPIILTACISKNASQINKVLENGLYSSYTHVSCGGWDEYDNPIDGEYEIVWSEKSFEFSVSMTKTKNPGMSWYWLEKIGLLTPDSSLLEGTICELDGFKVNNAEFRLNIKDSEQDLWIHWDRKTCLLMRFTAEYTSGEKIWYGYNWQLK